MNQQIASPGVGWAWWPSSQSACSPTRHRWPGTMTRHSSDCSRRASILYYGTERLTAAVCQVLRRYSLVAQSA
jgi:hypothetical protein